MICSVKYGEALIIGVHKGSQFSIKICAHLNLIYQIIELLGYQNVNIVEYFIMVQAVSHVQMNVKSALMRQHVYHVKI